VAETPNNTPNGGGQSASTQVVFRHGSMLRLQQ
jgi:hypothetical protein